MRGVVSSKNKQKEKLKEKEGKRPEASTPLRNRKKTIRLSV
jgi:hypothetical protein